MGPWQKPLELKEMAVTGLNKYLISLLVKTVSSIFFLDIVLQCVCLFDTECYLYIICGHDLIVSKMLKIAFSTESDEVCS